ncbi:MULTISPECIES: helix-turn-helix transcriptional regulator [unclassified Devosia]|uniref:helix-turn-helix transcriptional regulator n=1 Tax=unclassified Devosia TaxID=196773 RepID=UPI0025DBC474|nr:helix-turn-helix transcriptional regulator [Devosia sp.]MCR6636379.1 helix-turn-helix transcriptional regulator [Devosia sp.]
MRPIPAGELSDLIGSIYDCALTPSLWPATLDALRGRMAFLSATLAVVEMPNGNTLINAASGVDDIWLIAMRDYGREIMDQWGGADRVRNYPLDVPMVLSEVNPEALTPANRYHREVGLPRGVVDSLSVGLLRDQTAFGAITFTRHESAGLVGQTEMELANLFIPHLKRAVTISRLLEARAVESATYVAVLDRLSVAVLLVASDLRLIHANQAGEAMLRAARPFGLRAGRISGPPNLDAALLVALASSLDDLGRRGLGIPAYGNGGEELVLHVLPLAAANPLQGAAAAIFVAPSTSPPPAPLAAIASLFDLTPTEARVLELVGSGRTNAEIATTLNVAVSTVRTHLLRVFEKTRTHRQADLVGLIASFSLPIA